MKNTELQRKELEDFDRTNKQLRDENKRVLQLLEVAKEAIKDTEQLRNELESVCKAKEELREELSQATVNISSDKDPQSASSTTTKRKPLFHSPADSDKELNTIPLEDELENLTDASMDIEPDGEEDETCSHINIKHKRFLGEDDTYANKKPKLEGQNAGTGSNATDNGDESRLYDGYSFPLDPKKANDLAEQAFETERPDRTKRAIAPSRKKRSKQA
jgi:hypothetical protein